MKPLKIIMCLFCFMFTTHAFAKSNDYYQKTLAHVLTECDSKCKKLVFEQEVQQAFLALMDAVLNQLRFELSQKQKEFYE